MRKTIENLLLDVSIEDEIPIFLEDYFDFQVFEKQGNRKLHSTEKTLIKECAIIDKQKIIQLLKNKEISQDEVLQGLERISKNENNSLCLFSNRKKNIREKKANSAEDSLVIFMGSNRLELPTESNYDFFKYSTRKYGVLNNAEFGKVVKKIRESSENNITIMFELLPDKSGNKVESWAQIIKNVLLTHYKLIKSMSDVEFKTVKFISWFEQGNAIYGNMAYSLAGLYKTLYQEDNRYLGKVVGIDVIDPNSIYNLLVQESKSDLDSFEIFYEEGKRGCKVVERILPSYCMDNIYDYSGCYIITGGSGKIAQIIARHLLQTGAGHVILVGRRKLTKDESQLLSEFKKSQLEYTICDLSSYEQIDSCIKNYEKKYKKVNGIFHCAGTIKDSWCINKEEENVLSVLLPKMDVSLNLVKCIEKYHVKFLVFCSSLAAVTGNMGQSDYAVGNSFMDQIANTLNNENKHILSINWPLWDEGGMQITNDRKQIMIQATGMAPLPSSVAMQVLDTVIVNDISQVSVMYGKEKQMINHMKFFMGEERAVAVSNNSDNLHMEEAISSQIDIKDYFMDVLEKTVSIDKNEIDLSLPLSEFGMNSIMVEQISSALKKNRYDVPKSIFYEMSTFGKILDYIEKKYGAKDNAKAAQRTDEQSQFVDNLINKIWAEVVGIEVSEVDVLYSFADYGMDSIMVSQFNQKLKQVGVDIAPNTLYKVKNLKELKEILNVQNTDLDVRAEEEQISDVSVRSKVETKIEDNEKSRDMAIIGIDVRVSGATNAKQLWDLMTQCESSITEVPLYKWNHKMYYSENPDDVIDGKTNCNLGAFIEDGDCFDSEFFGITPNVAKVMDPQERILLESVWHALENAHYTKEQLKQKYKESSKGGVGVFVGSTHNSYALSAVEEWNNKNYIVPSSWQWAFANRVSYFYDFDGPSVPVDTGCSSSLTALYLACQSIMDGESDMAVVCGVNLYNHPSLYIGASKLQLLSSQKKYKIFAEDSDGFVPGEGVATILIKPLEYAKKDNDTIYGVIKSVGINHTGKTNTFFSPSVKAVRELINKVANKANIDLNTISYIEAGTTGAGLVDEMEFNALCEAFSSSDRKCAIGSIKQNIGHLESASSLVALIKVLLQFKMNQIAPNLFPEYLNPNIDMKNSPFCLEYNGKRWEDGQEPRRALVNSLSAGGVNACVIVESPPVGYNEVNEDLTTFSQGYSFKREKVWIVDREKNEKNTLLKKHVSTMLDENMSKLGRQIFTKKFTGTEFYLEDHLGVLPAVAYIELICEAAKASVRSVELWEINEFVLMQPFVYGLSNNEIAVRLIPSEDELTVEVYSPVDLEKTFARARLVFKEKLEKASQTNRQFDAVNSNSESEQAAKNYYSHLKRLNSCFGDRFMGIKSIHFGENFALTRAEILEKIKWTKDKYLYHPTLMDAGFQTIVAYAYNMGANADTIYMPFYVGKITFFATSTLSEIKYIYAHVKEKNNNTPDMWKYTLEYLDENKNLILRVDDYSIAPLSDNSRKQIIYDNVDVAVEVNTRVEQEENVSNSKEIGLLEKLVEEVCKSILQVDREFEYDEELLKYGFDSTALTELSSAINKRFGVKTTPVFFFERNSISKISEGLLHYGVSLNEVIHIADNKVKYDEDIDYIESKYLDCEYEKKYAIIGMSGAFPKSKNVNEYWENLIKGVDMTEDIPSYRWNWRDYDGEAMYGKYNIYCHRGGFIEDADAFDAKFFGISPVDAAVMDPQQRLVLEHAWAAMEDAGYRAEKLMGSNTSVFIGVSNADYGELLVQNHIPAVLTHSMITNRLSYLMGLMGKSEPCDAACASSLVAIDHAIQTLESGESDLAFAGGVNLLLSPNTYVYECLSKALSPSGVCRAFDKDADGYVRGEGVGVILIKRLKDAVNDGDNIHAVICGHSVGHAGKSSGLTVPNADAQARVITKAYRDSLIDMNSVGYIEAHGTGTKLGDPIELDGLKRAFMSALNDNGSDKAKCAISSVKTNIGHLESASGIASVIKVVMALKNGIIPKLINFKEINPYCEIENSRFHIVTENEPWLSSAQEADKIKATPRRAGVSAFGIGGVNSHVVLEEYICNRKEKPTENREKCVFVCSAKSPNVLSRYIKEIVNYINADKGQTENLLQRICYTMQLGRTAFETRYSTVVTNLNQLVERLTSYITSKDITNAYYCENIKMNRKWLDIQKDKDIVKVCEDLIMDGAYDELAEYWIKGLDLPWEKLYGQKSYIKLHMPTYPFSKERYWIPNYYNNIRDENTLEKTKHEISFIDDNIELSANQELLKHHQVMGEYILPGAFYITMILEKYNAEMKISANCVGNLLWIDNVHMKEKSEPIHLTTNIEPLKQRLKVYENGKRLLVSGVVKKKNTKALRLDVSSYISDAKNVVNNEEIYSILKIHGINMGDMYKTLNKVYTSQKYCVAEYSLKTNYYKNLNESVINPVVLDAAFQSITCLTGDGGLNETQILLPFMFEELEVRCKQSRSGYVLALLKGNENSRKVYVIYILDKDGNVCVKINDYVVKKIDRNVPLV